ncbi:unnamed protein product [Chrysoparadoxa australica]
MVHPDEHDAVPPPRFRGFERRGEIARLKWRCPRSLRVDGKVLTVEDVILQRACCRAKPAVAGDGPSTEMRNSTDANKTSCRKVRQCSCGTEVDSKCWETVPSGSKACNTRVKISQPNSITSFRVVVHTKGPAIGLRTFCQDSSPLEPVEEKKRTSFASPVVCIVSAPPAPTLHGYGRAILLTWPPMEGNRQIERITYILEHQTAIQGSRKKLKWKTSAINLGHRFWYMPAPAQLGPCRFRLRIVHTSGVSPPGEWLLHNTRLDPVSCCERKFRSLLLELPKGGTAVVYTLEGMRCEKKGWERLYSGLSRSIKVSGLARNTVYKYRAKVTVDMTQLREEALGCLKQPIVGCHDSFIGPDDNPMSVNEKGSTRLHLPVQLTHLPIPLGPSTAEVFAR